VVLRADGGVAADVADDAAADLPRPSLSRREQDTKGDAELQEERPPERVCRGHGW